MPAAHFIRLRGPWEVRPLLDHSPPRRIQLPSDWRQIFDSKYRGPVVLTRRFGRPTGLDAADRVDLVIEGADICGRVAVNDQPLGVASSQDGLSRFDITALLRDRNELTIEVTVHPAASTPPLPFPDHDDPPRGPICEVRLEIQSPQDFAL